MRARPGPMLTPLGFQRIWSSKPWPQLASLRAGAFSFHEQWRRPERFQSLRCQTTSVAEVQPRITMSGIVGCLIFFDGLRRRGRHRRSRASSRARSASMFSRSSPSQGAQHCKRRRAVLPFYERIAGSCAFRVTLARKEVCRHMGRLSVARSLPKSATRVIESLRSEA